MVILAIETTGPLASVALIDEGGSILQHVNHTAYSHLEELVPMIQSILKSRELNKEDVEAIAVSRGPGSFTGVRIGMATAKAIAHVWNKPIVEVPTLKCFAFGPEKYAGFISCPLFDARRGQVYAGAFRKDPEGFVESIIEEGAYDIKIFLALLSEKTAKKDKIMFYGDGIAACEADLSAWKGRYELAPEDLRFQTADRVALLGQWMVRRGMVTDAFSAKPEYLRQSEAERKLAGK